MYYACVLRVGEDVPQSSETLLTRKEIELVGRRWVGVLRWGRRNLFQKLL